MRSCVLLRVRPAFPSILILRLKCVLLPYSCINNLGRLSCPLCRSYYDPRSVRRLHVDIQICPDPAPLDYHNPESTNELGLIDGPSSETADKAEKVVEVNMEDEGKRHLTARLVSLVRQGAEGPEFQAILKQTKEWLRERPDEVRVAHIHSFHSIVVIVLASTLY